MERYKYLLAVILFLPVMAFSFDTIPREIQGVGFDIFPSIIPSRVNMRQISRDIDVAQGVYRYKYDNGENEVISYHSRYNKVFYMKREIGIYDRINYHFKVLDFIRCFIRKYGPPAEEKNIDAENMPEYYAREELTWEDSEIIMKLTTHFYSAMPDRKYVPGLNGKHITIEYIHKPNRNYIYGMDYNLPSANPCQDVR
mgnify:FL=1